MTLIERLRDCGSSVSYDAAARIQELESVCANAAMQLRSRLVHASPWGADLVDRLESAVQGGKP